MPRITYVEHNGTEHAVDVPSGTSLMQGAVNQLVPGIEGDCGGLCACATCHIYMPEVARHLTGPPGELERGMLEFAFDVRDDSRLACQIVVTDAMEGLMVHMPKRQY
jgi:ferredoxin, 2Fe-2S